MKEQLRQATYAEWQASLFGACIIAVGIGVLAASYVRPYVAAIFIIGVILHAWGMYAIHRRNR